MRTLPAAIAPVLVGSGLARGAGSFRGDALAAALIGAVAIQIAANFANDAADAARGADPPERIGPTRMVAAGVISARRMWAATWLMVGVATLTGVYLIMIAGWVVAAIGIVSVVAMLTYVGGPVPYGYRGLGEAAVFVFFGLVATAGSRYVHDRMFEPAVWWLGSVMGMLAAAILVANNLRDIDTDSQVGKRTLAVVLGRDRTRRLYAGLVIGWLAVVAVAALVGASPPATALTLLVFPLIPPLLRRTQSTDPATLIALLAATAQLQLIVGVVLAMTAAFPM